MRVVELNEAQMDWLLAVSYVYIQNQKFDQSIALLELVLVNYETNLDAIKGLSYCYFQVGRYQESVRACRRYLTISPRTDDSLAKAYLLLSKCYRQLNMLSEAKDAISEYQKLLESS